MQIKVPAVVLLAVGFVGCAVGPSVESFKPAHSPAGVEVVLNFDGRVTLHGELLEVRDDGLLVLSGDKVILVPFAPVRRGAFLQTGKTIGGGKAPAPALREELSLLSRFPQGLTPELLASLLAAYGQNELEVWGQ